MHTRRALLAIAVLPLALVACGDDDDDDVATDDGPVITASDTAAPASVGEAEDTKQIIEVVATDYKFTGLPATAPAGTQFALQNDSTKEVHEMVVLRLPDDVTQSVGEILAMTEQEQFELVGDIDPSMVIVALPGEAGQPVEGDGTLTEPGRYGVLCFIPVGGDVDVVREALDQNAEDPPSMGTGPPHITQGMYGEIVIE